MKWILLLLVLPLELLAGERPRFLKVSARQVMFNYGHLDGIQKNEKAVLLEKTESGWSRLGTLKSFEVRRTSSRWRLLQGRLDSDAEILLVRKKKMLKGHRPLKLGKKTILARPKGIDQVLEEYDQGHPHKIVKKDNFRSGLQLKTTELPSHHDLEILQISFWRPKDNSLKALKYRQGPETLDEEHKDSVFESLVEQTVNQLNSATDKRGVPVDRRLVRVKTNASDFNDELSQAAQAKMEREGDLWSADMNDRELREFILSHGLDHEKQRQKFFKNYSDEHEFLLLFDLDLVGHSSADDGNNQGRGYAYRLGYEYHFLRLNQNWAKFSASLVYERAFTTYNIGETNAINGFSNESSLELLGRYYLKFHPTNINQYAWYLGLGLRYGEAELDNKDFLEKTVTYRILSPTAQLGFKYRYKKSQEMGTGKVSFGLHPYVRLERITLSNKSNFVNTIKSSQSVMAAKIGIGGSLYF